MSKHFAIVVFSAAALAMALVLPLSAALSLALAFAAVAGAQSMAFALFMRKQRNPFSFWAIKFSLTLLFLAAALRTLHETALLSAPYFITGVVAAVIINVLLAARFSRQQDGLEK